MINSNGKILLEVRGLTANVSGVQILKGIDLTVREGEIHAIMGPNGSGKSTFAKVLAGHPAYEVTGGTVLFEGKDLFALEAEERARAGIFLGFQYPVEIPGVTNSAFLRLAYNTVQGARGKDELDPLEFDDFIREKMKMLEIDPAFLDRNVNEGFSGGEKKRNEILQLAALEPKLAILDETDSGLDIDALRVVAGGVNQLLKPDNACVLVTHYQRLLNYITPDYVHVMEGGRIIKTGGKELALELESRGYDWVVDETKRPAAGKPRPLCSAPGIRRHDDHGRSSLHRVAARRHAGASAHTACMAERAPRCGARARQCALGAHDARRGVALHRSHAAHAPSTAPRRGRQ